MSDIEHGDHEVEIRIVTDPAGRPAVLLQLPYGFVTIHRPEEVRQIALLLIESSDDLEKVIAARSS